MHTIVWLQLGEASLAAAELNRSMHAACYGPYNVRNEVDKHRDVVGGHFDNTHFVTGDGGFLQALVYGYGGLRVEEEGLRLLPPTLPERVGSLVLRNVVWRGCILSLIVAPATQTLVATSCASSSATMLCLVDALGGQQGLVVGGLALNLTRASFAYPGLLSNSWCG